MNLLDGSSGGEHPQHRPQHAEPRLYVQSNHLGQTVVGGCPRCAGVTDVPAWLREVAGQIEAAQQAQRQAGGQP